MSILDKILGSSYQRVLKGLQSKVDRINQLEDDVKKYKPQEFKNQTADFKNQIKISKIVDNINPEDGSVSELKKKVDEYIQEIDKCIAYLSR